MVESEYKFSWIYLLRNQSLLEIILQRRFAKEMESCVQVVSGLTIPLNNAKLSNAHHKQKQQTLFQTLIQQRSYQKNMERGNLPKKKATTKMEKTSIVRLKHQCLHRQNHLTQNQVSFFVTKPIATKPITSPSNHKSRFD